MTLPNQLVYAVFIIFIIFAAIERNIIYEMQKEIDILKSRMTLDSPVESIQLETDYLTKKSPPNKPSLVLSAANDKVSSLRTVEKDKGIVEVKYGGKGDAAHLGGFTEIDLMGVSENLWNFMLSQLAIKSLVDIGCGRGHSTNYFLKKGADVLCVEGSHDAVTTSLLPKNVVIEHDFSRGEWWPEKTYDAAWSVEFLEHVGRPYMQNYMPIFKKSALIFVTSSIWGGWHHVEVHQDWWWKGRFQSAGFIYSEDLTAIIRLQAKKRFEKGQVTEDYAGQHIFYNMLVFINPKVASLPQHKHLFGGHGCFSGVYGNRNGGVGCAAPDNLPKEFQSLIDCTRSADESKDEKWEEAEWTCSK